MISAARPVFAALVAMLATTIAAPANATVTNEPRSWSSLTTGNGHGFQVFDTTKNRVTQFLEHPYRFLRKNPDAPQSLGVSRRNLAYDTYFGIRGNGNAGWLAEAPNASPEYVDQTNIIHAPATLGSVQADSYFFAPFGVERNAMVGLLHAGGATDGYALFNFHLGNPGGWDGSEPDAQGESTRTLPGNVVVETGPGGGAMLYVPIGGADLASCENVYASLKAGQDLQGNGTCAANDIAVGFQKVLPAAGGWMGFVATFVEDASLADAVAGEIQAWIGGRSPSAILDDAKAEWDAWRKPPPAGALCSDDEVKVWRMGEATLRMGQVREPNIAGRVNHGMMLAALPVGEWHIGWVRDATYSIAALARTGHFAEAKMALDFLLNAAPVGAYASYVRNQAYRISVTRYFGSGEEESDWNQDGPNVEIDGWGLVLSAARQYVQASGDVAWLSSPTRDGSVWDALTGGIADPLAANLEDSGIAAADSSIWEVHDAKKRHFAYTTLAAARGFCDMAAIATLADRSDVTPKYQALEKTVREGFLAQFQDGNGALAGSVEELASGGYTDVAVAEAFPWNVLRDPTSTGSRSATATVALLESLKVASGGYKRNDDGLSSYDDNEWVFADFLMSNAYRRIGKAATADAILGHIVAKARANFDMLPELYNAVASDGPIGAYTGAVPMVGYGGGAFALAVLDRAGGPLTAPNDCGDRVGTTLPPTSCKSVLENLRLNGLGQADDADDPAGSGCGCSAPGTRRIGGGTTLFVALAAAFAALRRRRRR